MHLALWSDPLLDGCAPASGPDAPEALVERHPASLCTELLLRGQVDVALVPSLVVLTQPDAFDVLPGAALSTWANPFACLVLHGGLERVESIAYDPESAQEALIARIVLHEHYGLRPRFVPVPGAPAPNLLAAEASGALITGGDALHIQTDGVVVDLGREWFEMAGYPMVWGLFAVPKGAATPALVASLGTWIAAADAGRALVVDAGNLVPDVHAFYSNGLRLRLDDLAMASLTELRQYLYYYEFTEDIPELPLYALPETDR